MFELCRACKKPVLKSDQEYPWHKECSAEREDRIARGKCIACGKNVIVNIYRCKSCLNAVAPYKGYDNLHEEEGRVRCRDMRS